MPIPESIICVDCGEAARLIQPVGPDDVFQPGDIVSYRCSACLDRWDIELTEDDIAPSGRDATDVPRNQ